MVSFYVALANTTVQQKNFLRRSQFLAISV